MTSAEKEHILNTYYAEILKLKILLSNTDYQTIREFEGGEPMSAEIREQRANARTRINELEALVTETEAVEIDDSIYMPNIDVLPNVKIEQSTEEQPTDTIEENSGENTEAIQE